MAASQAAGEKGPGVRAAGSTQIGLERPCQELWLPGRDRRREEVLEAQGGVRCSEEQVRGREVEEQS